MPRTFNVRTVACQELADTLWAFDHQPFAVIPVKLGCPYEFVVGRGGGMSRDLVIIPNLTNIGPVRQFAAFPYSYSVADNAGTAQAGIEQVRCLPRVTFTGGGSGEVIKVVRS